METTNGILLESGTNELELVEFSIGENRYGINVIKVKEIINPVPVTPVPHSHRNIEGIIELRGEVLPVVSVAAALNSPPSLNHESDRFIVSEFNKVKVVFHVHGVHQIHRISWADIEKPSGLYGGENSHVTGVVNLNGGMVLLLDFEKVIVEINPAVGINEQQIAKLEMRDRKAVKLLIAEDSPMLRKLLFNTLTAAGFREMEFFENGLDALNFLESILGEGRDIEKEVQLIITDIEMPGMDGFHFTKKIKENSLLSGIPVIIFSSLITNDLIHKGMLVGADDQISKPDIADLISTIDRLTNS